MHKFILILLMLAPASLFGQSLKVMTYNIRYATESDGVNAWSKRKNKVIDLLKHYDPAIIGLQEALQSQIVDIVKNLDEYDYVGVGRDDGKTAGEYSPILFKKSKYKVLEQNTFWLSETPTVPGSKSWDAAITRVATWAKVQEIKSGKIFLVINTHFDHIGQVARKNSAGLLRAKATELGKGLPILIMGDFNCTRKELPYDEMMKGNGIHLNDPAPANAPGTYCTFDVNGAECMGIDYIFLSDEWNAFNYAVITDNDGKHYPSDHLPVSVEITGKK